MMIRAPDGGTERESLLNLFANEAARCAETYEDFRHASRSCKKTSKIVNS
jgi:hypothetical protein